MNSTITFQSTQFCMEIIDRQFYVLLTYELQQKKMHKIAKRILILLSKFGIQYLFSLLTYAFDIICGDIQAGVRIKDVREILGITLLQYQNEFGFSTVICRFFDSLHDFPRRTLSYLSYYISFPLTLLAIRSNRHSLSAIRFMQNELLPEINKHSEVHIPFIFSWIFTNELGIPLSSLPTSLFETEMNSAEEKKKGLTSLVEYPKAEQENDLKNKIKVDLFSVFEEYQDFDVLSENFLNMFFGLFPSITLASFIVAVSHDSFRFLDKFDSKNPINLEMFSKFVPSKNYVFAKDFDIPELALIKDKGCLFIFKILSFFSETAELDMTPLLSNDWINKDSQFNLLSYVPTVKNEISLFFNDANENSTTNMIPSDNFWASKSYISCITCNYTDLNKALEIISKTNQAEVTLYSLLRIKDKIPLVFEVFVDSLVELFFEKENPNNSEKSIFLEKLWEIDPKTMCDNVCMKYSSVSFNKVLASTPKKYQHYLYESKFVKFSTEIAIFSASQKRIKFRTFLENRRMDFEIIAQNITYNLGNMSDECLADFFDFSLLHFSEISRRCRNMINIFYSETCNEKSQHENSNFQIRTYDFSYKIKTATDELKFEASRRFESYINDEITAGNLAKIIEKLRTTNNNLYEYMISILISEMKYIDSHFESENQKIILLLVELIQRNVIDKNQINNIFSIILSMLSFPKNSFQNVYCLNFIEKSMQFLGDHTYFASQLLLDDNLKKNSIPLFEKIDNAVRTFTFQEFSDFAPEIELHPNVKKFSSVIVPPQKKIKSLQPTFSSDLSSIPKSVEKYIEFTDWIALVLIKKYLDSPEIINVLVNSILDSPHHFDTTIVQCCTYRFYSLMAEKEFDTKEGSFLRRNACLLGKLIGYLTLSINNPKNLSFLKLKDLIFYALSNGKLYGVVGFVVTLFMQSSPLFFPPNPMTSAILGILATISTISSLKFHIKNQIISLFEFFRVSIDHFSLTDSLFPDKLINNFDFNANLFNLSLLFSENQMERIISFDQNLYFCFISHCLVGKNDIYESQDRVRIIWAIFYLIREVSQRLAKTVISTINETLLKDLNVTNDKIAVFEAAKQISKKLSIALVSQTSFFDYSFTFSSFLTQTKFRTESKSNICNQKRQEVIKSNSVWIHQFLSEVTFALSISFLKHKIESTEIEKKTKNISLINLMKYSISSMFLELNIPLYNNSIQSNNLNDDDMNENEELELFDQLDNDLYNYLCSVDKLCMIEISKGYTCMNNLPDSSIIYSILKEIPSIESYEVALQTFFVFFDSNSQILFLEILVFILKQIFLKSINKSQRENLQSFAAFLMKSFILPPLAIQSLISLDILTVTLVDEIFISMINNELCSERQIEEIVSFICFYLIDSPHYLPTDFIQSLLACSFLPISQNFFLHKKLFKTKKLFFEFSILKTPNEEKAIELIDNVEYATIFQKWKNAIRASNESQILSLTKSCSRMPRDFFLSVIEKENVEDIIKFMKCLDKVCDLKSLQQHIFTAFSAIIAKSKRDLYQKLYTVITKMLYISPSDLGILSFLHEVRPLKFGDFTFIWIGIVCDANFISSSLANAENWSLYAPLVCDFSAALGFLNGSHDPGVFKLIYKSFLRFILVLIHDFPDFTSSIALSIISVLPQNFYQLKNIILSVSPKSVIQISPLTPDLKIDHLSDVHQICFNLLPQMFVLQNTSFQSQLENILKNGFDAEDVQLIIDIVNESAILAAAIVEQCFNITVNQELLTATTSPVSSPIRPPPLPLSSSPSTPMSSSIQSSNQSPMQSSVQFNTLQAGHSMTTSANTRTPFVGSHFFRLFCSIMCNATVDVISRFIECFVDQLRYPSRNTHFFSKLIIELFRLNMRSDGVLVSEVLTVALMRRCAMPPPHPWGLAVTVLELMSNKDLGFWECKFASTDEKVTMFLKSVYYIFCDSANNI